MRRKNTLVRYSEAKPTEAVERMVRAVESLNALIKAKEATEALRRALQATVREVLDA
jgi:hypothetical protein